MSTTASPPLPEEIELVRAFLNTLDLEAGVDAIGDRAGLRAWLAERGLVGARQRVSDDDVALAHEVREGLRRMIEAHTGRGPDREAVARVNELMAALPLRLAFAPDGSAVLAPSGDGVAGALSQVLAAVVVAIGEGEWDRLKLCDEDSCRWAFYDRSKNASRRWCSMQVCGNRAKLRSFRTRKKSEA